MVLVWGGCSVEQNYALLSFFFDGVPSPPSDERRPVGEAAGGPLAPARRVSMHTAFADRRCAECHGDRARFGFATEGFSDLDDSTCLRCHDYVLQEHAFLHGPVAAAACLACHHPHESRHPLLLVDASPALCLECHQPQIQGAPLSGVHTDLDRNCLECHHGHGGADRHLLRPPTPIADARPPPERSGAPPER